jgi:hypothetical protein
MRLLSIFMLVSSRERHLVRAHRLQCGTAAVHKTSLVCREVRCKTRVMCFTLKAASYFACFHNPDLFGYKENILGILRYTQTGLIHLRLKCV